MSDLFEDENEDSMVDVETVEDFVDVDPELDVDTNDKETVSPGLDSRRRLEKMLDDKRLRDELDDW
jgi:hypothetical protein